MENIVQDLLNFLSKRIKSLALSAHVKMHLKYLCIVDQQECLYVNIVPSK